MAVNKARALKFDHDTAVAARIRSAATNGAVGGAPSVAARRGRATAIDAECSTVVAAVRPTRTATIGADAATCACEAVGACEADAAVAPRRRLGALTIRPIANKSIIKNN